ncbi:MAG: YbhB/YbcL family Raf kinase inhibitor-like protein [Anaerolineae bacterium]|nr:YbhB/YbcL family Raf kinase inhibitor-like protein [Anaerolineae bacterium]
MKMRILGIVCLGLLFLAACASTASQPATEESVGATVQPAQSLPVFTEEHMPFKLISTAFAEGEPIPLKYSCDEDDISPPLAWINPPVDTQSYVLIMDDPDAPGGNWDHWILFNIPQDKRELQENMPISAEDKEPGDISVGNSSWGRAEYGGPCPPSGTHRYVFKLYALDTSLSLAPGATKSQVEAAMDGRILAQAELMGTYSR